jgi:hypothetical protein
MFAFRRTSLVALLLAVSTLVYWVSRRYVPTDGGRRHRYLYGQTGGLLYDPAVFRPGEPKPAGANYTRVLVMGRLASEDVSWVARELPDLETQIYTVDARDEAEKGVPANKGHEAMAYLTYIIDHYDRLPDVVLFFHPHRAAWHNNILLDIDTATTIKRLNDAHVVRQGYFNSRCHLDPGCPDWLHVDRQPWRQNLKLRPEEAAWTSALFRELHGDHVPVPKSISQPCCAQFAVAGDRIRQRPRADYVRYRDWVLGTPLDDRTSGRIMEYSWQYLFTGRFEFCPSQSRCYCDGYGICFEGGEAGLKGWLDVLRRKETANEELVALYKSGVQTGEHYKRLGHEVKQYARQLDALRDAAIERGHDPRIRARECGREWHEGDGF